MKNRCETIAAEAGIDSDRLRSVICCIAVVMKEQQQYLSDLDRETGDGDHGFNMARGFDAVVQRLKDAPETGISDLLKIVAMALISNVGGASGPLYGGMFLKASTAAKGLTKMNLSDFVPLFREGVFGIQSRGNAVLGDKTMIDVLLPVAESLEKDCTAGLSGADALANAEKTAAACMEKTRNLVARKGRASYLCEHSLGHIDPGAASSYLMIRAIREAFE